MLDSCEGQELKNDVVSTFAILRSDKCMQSTQYLVLAQKCKGIRTDKSVDLEYDTVYMFPLYISGCAYTYDCRRS